MTESPNDGLSDRLDALLLRADPPRSLPELLRRLHADDRGSLTADHDLRRQVERTLWLHAQTAALPRPTAPAGFAGRVARAALADDVRPALRPRTHRRLLPAAAVALAAALLVLVTAGRLLQPVPEPAAPGPVAVAVAVAPAFPPATAPDAPDAVAAAPVAAPAAEQPPEEVRVLLADLFGDGSVVADAAVPEAPLALARLDLSPTDRMASTLRQSPEHLLLATRAAGASMRPLGDRAVGAFRYLWPATVAR